MTFVRPIELLLMNLENLRSFLLWKEMEGELTAHLALNIARKFDFNSFCYSADDVGNRPVYFVP